MLKVNGIILYYGFLKIILWVVVMLFKNYLLYGLLKIDLIKFGEGLKESCGFVYKEFWSKILLSYNFRNGLVGVIE